MQQQLRAYAQHAQRQAASSPTPVESRGRKMSTTKRTPAMEFGVSQTKDMPGSMSPPTSFPSQVTTGWRKFRNSASSMASSDAPALSSSVPAISLASQELERDLSHTSNKAQDTGDSLRSDGTGKSGSASPGSSSAFQSSDGSRISREDNSAIRALTPASIDVGSSQAPSPVEGGSLRQSTAAEAATKNSGTQANRLKRKQKATESGTSCIMQ